MADLLARNERGVVAEVMLDHPEIDTRKEETRGRILDYVAAELNAGRVQPWGRKARMPDGSNKNTDALTYLRPDGLFEIYDAISGVDGSATWDAYGPFRQGENGYWTPADPVPVVQEPEPPPDVDVDPVFDGDLERLLDGMELLAERFEQLVTAVAALDARLAAVQRDGVRVKLR